MELAAALAEAGPQPRPGERGYERLKMTALNSMFEGVWIVGQAAEWDITVTHRQVKSLIARVKKRSRTVCAPDYAIERCSNGPAPPPFRNLPTRVGF